MPTSIARPIVLVSILLALAAVLALPCVANAMVDGDRKPGSSTEITVEPRAASNHFADVTTLLDTDPIWGAIAMLVVGYIGGKIIDSGTDGAVDRAIDDAIEVYENSPLQWV